MRHARPSTSVRLLVLLLAWPAAVAPRSAVASVSALEQASAPSPGELREAVEALLAADRDFSRAAAATDVVAALTTMFSDDVIVPGPAGLIRGRAAVTEALRAAPENLTSRAQWTPVRGGLSADGRHGFTFGFMTVTPKTGEPQALKYMAYWRRQSDGWRVAGYKRARRAAGEVATTMRPPHLPSAGVPVATDATRLEAQRRSLADAERAFSDEAQRIGLGPAFAKYGAPTAVNMGGAQNAGYVEGPEAIAAAIGAGAPGPASPVHWASESVIVASSGDLGISFGYIRPHQPPPGAPAGGQPFFTIWVRDTPTAPWRYIAE